MGKEIWDFECLIRGVPDTEYDDFIVALEEFVTEQGYKIDIGMGHESEDQPSTDE